MSVPEVNETDEVLEKYAAAREDGDMGQSFNELYDHAVEMHADLLELREGYDRCRKTKGTLILLRKKALQERDEARDALEEARGQLEELGAWETQA